MLDLLAHLIVWCQSCAPDAQSVAPAVGVIGGAAGAVGAIGGLAHGAANSAASGAPGSDDGAASGGDASAGGGDGASSDGGPDTSPFTDTTGPFKMHEAPDPPAYPDDPFHSPSADPQPIFSDGGQVDGSMSPSDPTTETDYINPDGTPMGSAHHGPGNAPHKPK